MSYKLRNVPSTRGMINLPDSLWQYAGWKINDELEIIMKPEYEGGTQISCTLEIVRASDFDYDGVIDTKEEEE